MMQEPLLILAVSSVEIEVKRLIGEFVPDAEWLVINLPSPDIFKMVKNYLALLPTIPKELLPSKRLLTMLQRSIALRNNLIHVCGRSGAAKSETDTEVANVCNEVLAAASDLLRLFDVYRGHTWALDHLGSVTRRELGLTP